MFSGTVLGMFAEKMTTYPMYTKLAINCEDRGTVTSKRLGKPIHPYRALASPLQKEYLYPSLYLARRIETLKRPVGMTEVWFWLYYIGEYLFGLKK